jgi:hypothetical protein
VDGNAYSVPWRLIGERVRVIVGSGQVHMQHAGREVAVHAELAVRRGRRMAMLVTSNRPVNEWGTVFGDPVVATAILDRLLHHSHVLTIRGDSYRLREKRRSGLLQKPAPAPQAASA